MIPILLVEDRDSLREMLRTTLESEGYDVEEAADGRIAVDALSKRRFQAVITDLKLPHASGQDVLVSAREQDPDLPVVLMTAFGTLEDAVDAMREGAYDFLAKPVDPDHLLLLLDRALERRRLQLENVLLRRSFAERLGFPKILGESPALIAVSRQLQKVAPTDATVLLEGESGTGKELFARAVHHLSPRRDRPFVALNCAAIPENLLENELFGHERGAFTGADRAQSGRLELADGGTLFLDEIGELSIGLQAKLLRVLQEKSFEKLGGNRTIEVDLRLVAATNRSLRQDVSAGRFREDLYFRLAVLKIAIPPLRERVEDLSLLAEHFLEQQCASQGVGRRQFSPQALEAIHSHGWPGNVRELQNAVERAVILAEGEWIEPPHLGIEAETQDENDLESFGRMIGLDGTLDEVGERARQTAERIVIRRALEMTGGHKRKAADLLQVNYKRLLARIRDLGLNTSSPPSRDDPEP
jgi:DNA-binding NtrC family response regulator